MKCPHCYSPCPPEAESCAACGFSAAALCGYLGEQWVKLERITDAAHCLRLEDTRQCEVVMDDFERTFPQAFFAAYLGMLPSGLNASELGFWLLNQGAFNTPQMQKRNDYGVVMVLNLTTKDLSVTFGYAIERFFDERSLRVMLQATLELLKAQDYGAAITTLIAEVSKVLRKQARRQPWKPDTTCGTPELAVQPLRNGHRSTLSRSGHLSPSAEP